MKPSTKQFRLKHRQALNITLSLVLLFSGCVPYINQPLQPQRARLGPETPQNKELSSLPAPKEKIVAAVYKFRDQTGQYKPSETGASWSTAVSQGTTAILLRALEESNWFVAIERENISNLLNERKIIRSSRAQYSGQTEENAPALPPLLFAGIILEGGIVSYESNILTGGIGLRYFGSGASGQYRQDMVTVYLRAISTTNGKILKTVYTSKTILSQEVDVGIFRYVSLRKLLEAETGFTYNEPSEMAVTEAIEKAVVAMVLEGQQDGYWQFANLADTTSQTVLNYRKESEENENADFFNHLISYQNRGNYIISLAGGINKFDGDFPGAIIEPYIFAGFGKTINPRLSAGLRFERMELSSGKHFTTTANIYSTGLHYSLSKVSKLAPYLETGIGLIDETGNSNYTRDKLYGLGYYGAGIEWLLKPSFGITAGATHAVLFTDDFDALDRGKYPDMIWSARIGINIYLGKQKVKKEPALEKIENNQ